MIFVPCSTGWGFLVLQDTGPYWVAGGAFGGLGKMGKEQTAVVQGRGTAWAGLGTGPHLPSRDRTADPEIPARKEEQSFKNRTQLSVLFKFFGQN